jgi:aspartate aminotransferase
MHLADRVRSLKGSATLAVTARAKALRAEGIDVIGLGAGEPDFDTPELVKDAAVEALMGGMTKYAPATGTPGLRERIAQRMRDVNGIECAASDIVVTVGAKHAVYEVIQCLVNPGDEVITLTPAWLSYRPMIELAGGTVVEVAGAIDQGFKVSPSQLQAALSANTAAIILNSPCNPTGVTYTPEEIRALALVIASHPRATLISDEIYEDLIYPELDETVAPFSPGSMAELRERTVTINGLSKAMAMTGWRIGWACAPGGDGALAKAMGRLQSQMTSGITSFIMPAAVAALDAQAEVSPAMREVFATRAKRVFELLSAIDGFKCVKPTGAFYAFPDVSECFGRTTAEGRTVDSAGSFAEALLEEAKVAVVPGEDFGAVAANHIRISFACDEATFVAGIQRIADWVATLK